MQFNFFLSIGIIIHLCISLLETALEHYNTAGVRLKTIKDTFFLYKNVNIHYT